MCNKIDTPVLEVFMNIARSPFNNSLYVLRYGDLCLSFHTFEPQADDSVTLKRSGHVIAVLKGHHALEFSEAFDDSAVYSPFEAVH